jgi:anti-sigma28 factor (negative regulator of flagellin synthesis)
MKVEDKKPVSEVERVRTPSAQDGSAAKTPAPTDKVSVEQSRAAATVVDSARKHVEQSRPQRLKEIEAAVRSGSYRPDPGRVAEEILNAAEVDAKLRALFAAD